MLPARPTNPANWFGAHRGELPSSHAHAHKGAWAARHRAETTRKRRAGGARTTPAGRRSPAFGRLSPAIRADIAAVGRPLAAFPRAERLLSGKVTGNGSLPEGRGVGYPDLPRLRRQGAAGGPDLLPVWR